MLLNLQNSWSDLEKLEKLDLTKIAIEHPEASDYKVYGYWDDNDNFYEEIAFIRLLYGVPHESEKRYSCRHYRFK